VGPRRRVCPGLPNEKERHTNAPAGDITVALGSCPFVASAAATIGDMPHGPDVLGLSRAFPF
jgi:hypothetical protein